MGDVNHRCANSTKKHVHSTTKEGEREREQGKRTAVVVFFNLPVVQHIYVYVYILADLA